jgi:histidyl-tRNA synthetase
VIKVSNRKVLDGLMEAAGLSGEENQARRLTVLRALDKVDRIGLKGVSELLGIGRTDDSGARTPGAQLSDEQRALIMGFIAMEGAFSAIRKYEGPDLEAEFLDTTQPEPMFYSNELILQDWTYRTKKSTLAKEGIEELQRIVELAGAAGHRTAKLRIHPSVVRGLEYYTGPVFEAEITIPVVNEDGQTVRFGSVGGGGRYDGLVERFLGTKVPATGFSIGVSRLAAALAVLSKGKLTVSDGPVVVLVMEKDRIANYQRMTQSLRSAGIRAEMYLGTSGMKAQMKYADKRGAPCVVIQGGDERAKGEVQIKDLIEGAKAAATIMDSREWREGRPAQFSIKEDELVARVREVLSRHGG